MSKSNAHPDTIKPVLTPAETAELKADPCYPDRYSTMAAEVQLTQKISDWWQSDKFKAWSNKVCNDNVHCIQDAYLVTNAGITRTYRYWIFSLHLYLPSITWNFSILFKILVAIAHIIWSWSSRELRKSQRFGENEFTIIIFISKRCQIDKYVICFRNMSNDSMVMDPVDMQPFIHSRKGVPPNTLLVR